MQVLATNNGTNSDAINNKKREEKKMGRTLNQAREHARSCKGLVRTCLVRLVLRQTNWTGSMQHPASSASGREHAVSRQSGVGPQGKESDHLWLRPTEAEAAPESRVGPWQQEASDRTKLLFTREKGDRAERRTLPLQERRTTTGAVHRVPE